MDEFETLYERAVADHAKWRGKAVRTRCVWGGNGDGSGDWCGWVDLPKSVEVTVCDMPLTIEDCREHDDDGGLIDVMYPLAGEVGPWDNLKHVPDDVTGCEIDGPTYYADGRVDYPPWWPENMRNPAGKH